MKRPQRSDSVSSANDRTLKERLSQAGPGVKGKAMTWFVTTDAIFERCYGVSRDDCEVWTVSQYPDRPGWDTDSGYPGYGMPRVAAQFLADAANEKEQREGRQFPLMVGERQ